MQDYEKLGAFYLGKVHDMDQGETRDELLLYDSKDLTTHAMCVGMTGSGKTGLCISLLEEAAIDGIPSIAIDPKGDLGNLFLTFPDMAPSDFRPWIDEAEAARKGMTPDEYAASTAKTWKEGLAEWGQTPDRIKKFRDAVDMAIYTPGSRAGLPLTVLRSFDAPPQALMDDSDAFRERVTSATSGLLGLIGVDADPVRSREHILIATILTRAWQEGRNVDIAGLIQQIQSPPFDKVGVMDMDTFFPSKDRVELAMSLNSLLASPSFASWMEGEPLNIKNLLYTSEGKPRLSVISIAHMNDAERMFFVTILLNEILAWVRTQSGTSSLRALLYMDEIFGYFPPTATPPSKAPMLTLLKQARAYGLGVVLATQNPVDLDYKGLSNTGTWFLGRLQAERDKMRVLEGLEGASAEAGSNFDRQKMEATLAGLNTRVFLMNNVHEDQPVVFQTRWALSYLRGPLTRTQITTLMEPLKNEMAAKRSAMTPHQESVAEQASPVQQTPILPPDVDALYLRRNGSVGEGNKLVYRPSLMSRCKLHFSQSTYKIDAWQKRVAIQPIGSEVEDGVWDGAMLVPSDAVEIESEPEADAGYAPTPSQLSSAKNFVSWGKELKAHLYRTHTLVAYKCVELKIYSEAEESQADFFIRLKQIARESRDTTIEQLRKKYAPKIEQAEDRIEAARSAVDREKDQAKRAWFDTAISVVSTVLGVFGRKGVGRAGTSMRTVGRAAQQRGDVSRAEEKQEDLEEKLEELKEEFDKDIEELEENFLVENMEMKELSIRPRKTDIDVGEVALLWTPWRVDGSGIAEPMYELGVEPAE